MTKRFHPTPFPTKHPCVPLSIFSQMSQLAAEHQAINLSQGFPDFPVDPKLIELITKYMLNGQNQYAPMIGVDPLRKVIQQKYLHYYKVQLDKDQEITITAGGTQAIFTSIATLITPGDEVIIFEPAYDSYKPSVETFGGKVVPVKLLAPNFEIDWQEVKSRITPKTKLIIINNPNNPTGKLLQASDIHELEKIVQEYGIYILSDEVYEHIIYDDHIHHTVLSSSILREKSFVIASFGKVLHATGWKIGYLVANPLLSAEFRKIHQFNVFSVNTPVQYAIAEYLQDVSYYQSIQLSFQQKRNYMLQALQHSKLQTLPCQGTYFLLVDYSACSSKDELDFAKELTLQHQVATIPVSAFYSTPINQHMLRICFAKEEQTLEKAVNQILAI